MKHLKKLNELFTPPKMEPVRNMDNFEIEDIEGEIPGREYWDIERLTKKVNFTFEETKTLNLLFGELRIHGDVYHIKVHNKQFGAPSYDYSCLVTHREFEHDYKRIPEAAIGADFDPSIVTNDLVDVYEKYKDCKYYVFITNKVNLGRTKSSKFSNFGFATLQEVYEFINGLRS